MNVSHLCQDCKILYKCVCEGCGGGEEGRMPVQEGGGMDGWMQGSKDNQEVRNDCGGGGY